MADAVRTRTRMLTRQQIAEFIKSPRGVLAFEDLTADASQVLPEATQQAQAMAEAAQDAADMAMAAAAAAQDAADRLAQAMEMLQAQTAQTAIVREELAQAMRRIAGLEQGTTP